MRTFLRIKTALIAVLTLLTLALAAMPALIRSTEEAMGRAVKHDIAWIGVHGREEFNEVHRALLLVARDPGQAQIDRARLAYDVMTARLETWRRGAFGALAGQIDGGTGQVEAIRELMARFEAVIERLPAEDALVEGLDIIARVEPMVERMSRAAFMASLDDKSQNQMLLARLQNIQHALIVALSLGGFLLLGLLLRHNALLARAHATQKRVASENIFLATHDGLTRLKNRASVLSHLQKVLEGDMPNRPAVLMIDLDGFKPINDVLGHKAGDALLQSVASRLADALASSLPGIVGRFGGDEFVIVVDHVADMAAVTALGRRILADLHEPHEVEGHRVGIDASIGISFRDGSEASASDLVNSADIALVKAKARGKGLALVYEAGMGEEIAGRQKLESDMAEADFWAEFTPFYQPVVDLATGRIVGVETLARWSHPVRGLVAPAEFIPIAESSGRIVEIGWVILEKACRDALAMPEDVTVAVNISAVQLMRSDAASRIDEIRCRTGLPPSRLKLEVTESVLITDARSVRAALQKLQAMGVAISLDDFGTGFSSMAYLSGFGFNELKIDRSFVKRMTVDRRSMSIVQTIVALARNLDMGTVGEGVETEEQARLLQAAGCSRGQGFLFGRPMPFEMLMDRFRAPQGLREVA